MRELDAISLERIDAQVETHLGDDAIVRSDGVDMRASDEIRLCRRQREGAEAALTKTRNMRLLWTESHTLLELAAFP